VNIAIDAPRRPAISYYGGKWSIAEWIIGYFPSHMNYVEPCGGGASVLLQKPMSQLEVYNDQEENIVNFFRVLRDFPDELIWKIQLTPYARCEFERCRVPSDESIENARRFFASAHMGISSTPFDKATGWRSTSSREQKYDTHSSAFLKTKNELLKIADRLSGVQIECRDAKYIIERYDNETSLIYFDPPYVAETRSQKKQYLLEVDNTFHIEAADLLHQCAGYVVVSGYACSLYTDLYERHDWQRVDKEVKTNSGGKRIESLWLSPRTVKALAKPVQSGLFSGVHP